MSERGDRTSSLTTIVAGRKICTMINTLTVKPEKQQELMAYLERMTEEDVVKLPGFISANFHLSEDGTRIVNYAQWRSVADLQAMLEKFPEHVAHCQELALHISIQTDLVVAHTYQAADARTNLQ